ncbi:MAG: alpha/beta hydrolase [Bacteroidetes bacterium]|nr:alpha/beta hydrolase [Bacteroidota bacterium]
MNKLITIIILCFVFIGALGQQEIPYGSNNGKYIKILNTEIYYEEYGQGPPLILLQGGMGGISNFALCIPELSKHFRVIAPDTPGQGRSGLADSMSYYLLAEYSSQLIDKLNLDSAYVMGWSDGGNTGLILANKRPDKIRKVLASGANYLLSGYPSIANDSSDWKAQFNSPEFAIENKEAIEQYVKKYPRDWKKFLIDINIMWHQEIYFSPNVLKEITIPVMIVLGDRDEVTLEHGMEMHHLIKNSQLCILPNTSHQVFHERPTLINQIAIEFFEN